MTDDHARFNVYTWVNYSMVQALYAYFPSVMTPQNVTSSLNLHEMESMLRVKWATF